MPTLDQIEKLGPLARLTALNKFIAQADAAQVQAREARIRTVAVLRRNDEPATWRRLAELTGLSEQHLRAAVASLPEKANQPNA